MPTYQLAHEFAVPLPVHMLTPAAESARLAVRNHGARRKLDRAMASLVTDVGNPGVVKPFDGSTVTANGVRMLMAAQEAGFEARIHELARASMVEGHRAVRLEDGTRSWVGFRAWWTVKTSKGEESMGAAEASWHSPWRYELIDDARIIKMDEKAHTGCVGYRTLGQGTRRLTIVASPLGTPIGHTALLERVRGYAEAD